MTTLPTAYGWLLGVTILMFVCRIEDFKLLLNILIGKGLFNVYYLVIKNVQEKDIIDYLLPYMTIFERLVLSDHVFAIIFSLVVLYVIKGRHQKPLIADLKTFFNRCAQVSMPQDKLTKLDEYAKALCVYQSQNDD
jgi:hypothetical protein